MKSPLRTIRTALYLGAVVGVATFALAASHPATAGGLIDPSQLPTGGFDIRNGTSLPSADVLAIFTSQLGNVQSVLVGYAEKLFLLLVSLDVFWMVAQFMLTKDNIAEFLAQMATKVFTVVFIYYVVIEHGADLLTLVIGSFYAAAGQATSGVSNFYVASPSGIFAQGQVLSAVPFAEAFLLNAVPNEVLGNGATNLLTSSAETLTAAGIATVAGYTAIAAEYLIALLEVYVVVNLGIIVTGFLGSRYTERYGQGFTSFGIHAGVKLFFIYIMVGLLYPILSEFAALDAIPIVGPLLYAGAVGLVAALMHAVPGFAASALSGQANASGQGLAGAMMGAMAPASTMMQNQNRDVAKSRADDKEQKQFAQRQASKVNDRATSANRQMMWEERSGRTSFERKSDSSTPASSSSPSSTSSLLPPASVSGANSQSNASSSGGSLNGSSVQGGAPGNGATTGGAATGGPPSVAPPVANPWKAASPGFASKRSAATPDSARPSASQLGPGAAPGLPQGGGGARPPVDPGGLNADPTLIDVDPTRSPGPHLEGPRESAAIPTGGGGGGLVGGGGNSSLGGGGGGGSALVGGGGGRSSLGGSVAGGGLVGGGGIAGSSGGAGSIGGGGVDGSRLGSGGGAGTGSPVRSGGEAGPSAQPTLANVAPGVAGPAKPGTPAHATLKKGATALTAPTALPVARRDRGPAQVERSDFSTKSTPPTPLGGAVKPSDAKPVFANPSAAESAAAPKSPP